MKTFIISHMVLGLIPHSPKPVRGVPDSFQDSLESHFPLLSYESTSLPVTAFKMAVGPRSARGLLNNLVMISWLLVRRLTHSSCVSIVFFFSLVLVSEQPQSERCSINNLTYFIHAGGGSGCQRHTWISVYLSVLPCCF